MAKLPRPKKYLGQHFLKDKQVIQKITDWPAGQIDCLFEVGPGPGVLTKNLVEIAKTQNIPFYAIEKDASLKEQLIEIIEADNLFIQDALKFDWSAYQNNKIWLVSNLPYNVGSLLYRQFMDIPAIKIMTLMFQKEVGEKLIFREQTKNSMSSLLALTLTYFDSRLVCKVKPGAFHPPPKVDSIVVEVRRKKQPLLPWEELVYFEKFLRWCFKEKRKQLKSLLKGQVPNLSELLIANGYSEFARAETLDLDTLHKIYRSQT